MVAQEVHLEIQTQLANYTKHRPKDNKFLSKHKCSNNSMISHNTKVTLPPSVAQLSLIEWNLKSLQEC